MRYWQRYWKVFTEGLQKSTGEQMIGALVALGIVIYQIHYGIITKDQTTGAYWSIAWPYVILVGFLLLRHLVKTPAEIDAALSKELESAIVRENALKTRLSEIEDARPCIVMREVYTEKVFINQNGISVCIANVLRVKIENSPLNNFPGNEAKNVTASVSFYDQSGNLLLQDKDARWTASSQPVGPHTQSIVPLLGMDFPIGARRDLDIAFAETSTYKDPIPSLVALNNDNFHFQRWRKPDHILVGERFVAKVRVSGMWVNTEISVEFWAEPQGEIKFTMLDSQ